MSKLISAALLLLWSSSAFAAIIIVQSKSNNTGSSGTVAVTLTSAVASGDAVVYVAQCGNAPAAFGSIADDKSDTFGTPDVNYDASNVNYWNIAIGHLTNITSGPQTFTLTCSSGTVSLLEVYELSGLAASPLDATGTITTSGATGGISYTAAQSGEFDPHRPYPERGGRFQLSGAGAGCMA